VEPVTHILTGACLSRAGFNRRVAYATLTMAIAAEMPDIDTVWSWLGPVEGFGHHRGITHTFLAFPVEAAVLVCAVYLLHRWRRARARKVRTGTNYSSKPLTEAPVRWWLLYVCALVGLLSHLFLDYTNNYGIRPFYPFNPHWYAASIAFIFDPVIFLLLAFALVLPPVFGLVSAEVGAKANPFRGRWLTIAALVCIVAWLGARAVAHQRAVEFGMQQTYDLEQLPVDMVVPQRLPKSASAASADTDSPAAPVASETELVQPPAEFLQAQHVLASPNPLDPFRWALAIDFGPLYQLANVNARTGAVSTSDVAYPKLPVDTAIRAAEASPLGRVYLDWSSMPIITEDAPVAGTSGSSSRRVLLRDPRFMGDISWLRLTQTTPLTGVVTVAEGGHVLRESMDGRREPPGHGPVYEANLKLPSFGSGRSNESEPTPAVKAAPPPVPVAPPVQHVAMLPKFDLPMSGDAKANAYPTAASKVSATPTKQPATPPSPEKKVEIAKAEAPSPSVKTAQPASSKAGKSAPVVSKPQPAAPVPSEAKADPAVQGEAERADNGPRTRVERFKNWLHWLANGS
jgi:inner membrane protein